VSGAPATLELRDVHRSFGATRALRGIDLRLDRGQTGVLLGSSGCGKSTLLRLVIGLQSPDRGEVRFDGAAVTPDNVQSLRPRMGYVIQEGGLFPHLTALENVELMARHMRWTGARRRARTDELRELVALPSETLDRYPLELSGGQRQRVSLMRALMLDPELLLLDEPLAALDPITRADLQRELRVIFRELHKTVLLVTHDVAEAAFFGDWMALMRDGELVQRGCLDDLERTPVDDYVTRFIAAQRSAR
jgi:osmoprotectant transport system ATP-binding protein